MESNPTWYDRLELLIKYRRFLLQWTLLGCIVGVVVAFLWPPRYRAVASFLPPVEEGGGILASIGPSLKLGKVSDIESGGFYAILKSRRLKDSIDVKFDLRKRYHVDKIEKAYDIFDSYVKVDVEAEEGIGMSRIHAFYIRVDDRNPRDAAAMADAIIQYTDRITSDLTTQRARLTREFLEQRTIASQESLRVAEDALQVFSTQTGVVAPEAQIEATITALGTIEEQIAANDVQLHVMRTTLGASHPSVRESEERRKELEKQRDQLSGKIDRSSTFDVIGLRKSPELALSYTRLFRKMKTYELLVSFFTSATRRSEN